MEAKQVRLPRKAKTAKLTGRIRPARKAKRQEAVQIAANSYCLQNYAVGYTGGIPRRLSLRDGLAVWIVPVVLTSAGYGVVGEVGVLAIDAITHEVIGATPREEVKKAGADLAREKRDALDAAFHRARKV